MFPAGAPGVALLVLRSCIAFELAGCAFPAGWKHAMFIILLSLLVVGLLTPAICGFTSFAVFIYIALSKEMPNANVTLVVLSALSLAFLGPGAFSVDARLFARRIVVSTSSTDATAED
jgi:uncharacterized membrane protein YphA (DoxX/SURF4 family)